MSPNEQQAQTQPQTQLRPQLHRQTPQRQAQTVPQAQRRRTHADNEDDDAQAACVQTQAGAAESHQTVAQKSTQGQACWQEDSTQEHQNHQEVQGLC